MAYYKIDKDKFARLRKEAQQFQDDIVCAAGTDFMRNVAEAENRMIFDILNGVESEATADVAEVKHGEWSVAIGYDVNKKVKCSVCELMSYEPTGFCPHCGAKMDGVKEE